MAGGRDAQAARVRQTGLDDRCTRAVAVALGLGYLRGRCRPPSRLMAQVVLALVVLAVLLQPGELALAGGVVHHRDQLHQRMLDQFAEHLQRLRMADLATQVQAMVGARVAAGGGRADRRAPPGRRSRCLRLPLGLTSPMDSASNTVVIPAATICGVVRLGHRQGRREQHLRTRLGFLFDGVAVQLDQAGQQVVSPRRSISWAARAPSGAMAAMTPSSIRTAPSSSTRSGSTTRAWVR